MCPFCVPSHKKTSSRKLKSSGEAYGSKNYKDNEVIRITEACVRALEAVFCDENV